MKQLVLDLIPAPLPTFNNFVRGLNGEAFESCFRLNKQAALILKSGADQNANTGGVLGEHAAKVLYLWGVSGSGKTHLVSALKNVDKSLHTGLATKEYTRLDIIQVVVDDVEKLNDAEQVQLFSQINHVNQPGDSGCVVVTGCAAPRDLRLRPELTSRLGSGLVFQLHPLTDAEKIEALHAHANTRGFALRDDVTQYLLRHARRDMASLISFLDALDRYSLETSREITLPLLREMSTPELALHVVPLEAPHVVPMASAFDSISQTAPT